MPEQPEIPCGPAVLTRPHAAHDWQPQPGMDPVRCPGHGDQAEPHACNLGASTYYCPTSGGIESDCHGGFDTCCDQPQLHVAAVGSTSTPDPLAPFRALADQYAAKAAEAERNAEASIGDARLAQQGIAAGWQSAEFLLRHTLDDLDSPRTTGNNPLASDNAETCCVCGGRPVTYENYRDQVFCAHCSECQCSLPDGTCAVPLCPDCEARPGDEHADGCDVARCPTTGRQRLTCDQGESCAGHLCRTRWAGRLPELLPPRPTSEDAAAHFILTKICTTNGYRTPPPGVPITIDDLANLDQMIGHGTPLGEAVGDVIGLAAWRAQQADAVLDQRIRRAFDGPEGI
ncbi:hypothetical protein [Streptomyces sp. NPDC056670]|uniref:hypothetical protein n=1 Tax=Streptomyces sp. NPDC056670 TaxID=3345904 RepID=UPI00369538A6